MKYKVFAFAVLLSTQAWAQDTGALAARAPKLFAGSNHGYVAFKPELCKASPDAVRDLEAFDKLLYAAAVNMRELCNAQASGRGASALPTYESNVDEIKLELKHFVSQGSLGNVAGTLMAALDDETDYIRTWVTQPRTPVEGGSKKVAAASQKLHRIYDSMLKLYPKQEPAINESFYNPLCALDFL